MCAMTKAVSARKNPLMRVTLPEAAPPRHRAVGGAVERQCAISTGSVIDCRICRVAPPRMSSRMREWP